MDKGTHVIMVITSWAKSSVCNKQGVGRTSVAPEVGADRQVLGSKVMINIDSVLKSRDTMLPTKVYIVKAMILPVVLYGCESWTIKKDECQRIDALELWC